MKRFACFCITALICASGISAQTTIRNCFAAMPDSLLPYLTKNNRLDCIDFAENDMKTPVDNLLDGKSHMEQLTDNYLLMQLNKTTTLQMKLLPRETDTLICMVKTMQAPEPVSMIKFYTTDWTEIDILLPAMAKDQRQKTKDCLISYSLSADSNELTVTQTPIFTNDRELKPEATNVTKYKWNGLKFLKIS